MLGSFSTLFLPSLSSLHIVCPLCRLSFLSIVELVARCSLHESMLGFSLVVNVTFRILWWYFEVNKNLSFSMATNTTTDEHPASPTTKVSVVPGPIIIGGGPSGLAVAASLRRLSVPFVILERSDGIADLWRNRTYDRLSLHLPKHFCRLPHLPFPPHFPTYPSKSQFLAYLRTYSDHFSAAPLFNREVVSARFDSTACLWRVTAIEEDKDVVEFASPWVVVATGENAEAVVPEVKGRGRFKGGLMHSSEYRSGGEYEEKRVLVVGCGNSGMEMCLDLWEHGAMPFMSVRSGVHVLPRELLGTSTFGLAMKLLKWFPVRIVDKILVVLAKIVIGDTKKYGIPRPKIGPIELKNNTGKTPVLDVGALSLIKKGEIKIVPEVESLSSNGAKFVDGREMEFDTVIFATGYRSNVPFWLKDCDFFSDDGKPKTPYPNSWKGENGLYSVGFTSRGLLGASADAVRTAFDIAEKWKNRSCPTQNPNWDKKLDLMTN